MTLNLWFLAAGGCALALTLLHVFAGSPSVVRPTLAAKELDAAVKYLNYYCWHLVSISLALMAAAFLWSGLASDAWEVAILGTATAAGYCIWGVAMVITKQQSFRALPQGWLFLPVAVLGLVGFLA